MPQIRRSVSVPSSASVKTVKPPASSVRPSAAPVAKAASTPAKVESTSAAPAQTTPQPLPSSTTSTPSTERTAIFSTPALTTTFTPPAACTSQHLTMLESDAYRIWMNEPQPVPNTTFSECYPPQFMTSYLAEKAETAVPAFSPLVCPGNYHTVFQQSMPERPLYIACCPSGFRLHPPDTSTPGRPAYGGTCYSDIMTVSVTQYDNSSSSGVTLFAPTATGNQAYAHPIDGFALVTSTQAAATTSQPNLGTNVNTGTMVAMDGPGTIVGIAIGGVIAVGMILTALFYCIRTRKKHPRSPSSEHGSGRWPGRSSSSHSSATSTDDKTLITLPYGETKVSELSNGQTWVPELGTGRVAVRYATHEVRELAAVPSPRVSQSPRIPSTSVAPTHGNVHPPPPPRSPLREMHHRPTPSQDSTIAPLFVRSSGDGSDRISSRSSANSSHKMRRHDSRSTASTGISPPTSPAAAYHHHQHPYQYQYRRHERGDEEISPVTPHARGWPSEESPRNAGYVSAERF